MRIAVASNDFRKVTGHAGRARKWLVFEVDDQGAIAEPSRVELPAEMVFHHFQDDAPHPLDGISALIAISAGEGFLKHMKKRGVEAVLTSETDPVEAVRAYISRHLPPPKPRPIGSLICKTIDIFSKHK